MKSHSRNRSQNKEEKVLRTISRNTPLLDKPEKQFKKSAKKRKNQKSITSPDIPRINNNQSMISGEGVLEICDLEDEENYYEPNPRLKSSHKKNLSKEQIQLIELAQDLFQQGKEEFKNNNFEKACSLFIESLQKDSNLLESQYLLAVCYLSTGECDKSIEQFNDLMEKQPNYKRNMYLLCSIAYKKTNDFQNALEILQKATKKFPKYYDAYIYKGKLQVKAKQFEEALKDFNTAIKLNSSRGYGYIGKADCLRFIGQYPEAIHLYTEAMGKEPQIAKIAILKRAITYIENKQFDEALQGLQIILENDPVNSEAYYFKGLMYYKQKNLNEAIISFEQAIKHNNSRRAVTKALYEIAKIKIELRDYYQAFYTLCRADYLDVDKKSLEKFRVFTDGVTFLMKRKFKEGIENLSNLINKNNLGDFLKPLAFSYRAYGYFCLGKHQKTLNDLTYIESFIKLEKASLYNKYLVQGIFAAQNNQFESAMNFFTKSNKLYVMEFFQNFTYNNRMEPYFYKAMTLVKFTNILIPKTDKQKIRHYYKNSLKNLEKAYELNPNNANLCYHLGLVRFALQKTSDSIIDLERAMEKSEDNVAKYFYTKGLVYSELRIFKKALEDFSITISIDENYAEAYLNRAKCFFLSGDRNAAFADLQKFIQLKPSSPDIHLWAGNLLFNIGAVEDAAKAYSHIDNIAKNPEFLLLRCKCYMVLKELNSALSDMQKLLELDPNSIIKFDQECLNCLKNSSMASQNYRSESSRKSFQDSIKRLDKLIEQKRSGIFFKLSDSSFFCGLNYFYLQNYEKALKYFNQSLDQKKDFIKEKEKKRQKEVEFLQLISSSEGVDPPPLEPSELEEYDFENRTYNIYEFQLNVAICFIMLKRFPEAFQHLQILQEILQDNDTQMSLEALLKVLSEEITALEEGMEVDQTNDEENSIVTIFPTQNRLCSIFPSFQLPFIIYKNLEMRLSFCLPYIELPNMEPIFDNKLMETLTPAVVENKPEAPWIRRTQEGIVFTDNVQYFEDLDLKTDSKRSTQQEEEQAISEIDLKDPEIYEQLQPQSRNEKNHKKKQQFNYDELMFDNSYQLNFYNNEQNQYEECEDFIPVHQKADLKQHLQLDDDIEKKLNRMLEKKKQKEQN